MLEAEMDASLGYSKNEKGALDTDNNRNGDTPKTVKSKYGEFEVEIPKFQQKKYIPNTIRG